MSSFLGAPAHTHKYSSCLYFTVLFIVLTHPLSSARVVVDIKHLSILCGSLLPARREGNGVQIYVSLKVKGQR